ncbi:WD repeat-containing protein on Y chromosome-like isoform X1 [Anopheles albimanus]|uniref:WD repeat-containing protein on Y chromosome-like isoform X1 n=1 Tax=Anopheles albimanus TaxID=7167 RepID=UPI00163F122C|nr:WD repeat-containing protein on Y chromosome-like isoform X1 [Anopheles albimanus]XP_035778806.1 WD repeat-containing protein on Y chromosome-like isoform X1 [Anopheles albimanus]
MAPTRFSLIPEDREIHRVVSGTQIENLRTIFAANNGRLKREELRKVLASIGLQYTDEQYRTLFLQINTDHDEFCQWDELLSYLILGFQDDDPLAVQQSLDPPISEEIALKLSRQVYTIARIDFCPMVYYDGSISWLQGHWITTSREGVINFWTKEWKRSLRARSTPSRLKRSKTWLLDAIPLPDQRAFCVASLESELRFYDVVAGSFVLKTVIERLPHPISALDYWYERGQPSKLLVADCAGHVAVLELYPDRKVVISEQSFSIVTWVSWKDVMRGRYPPLVGTEFGQLLVDQVRMVRYVEKLNTFIAASEENPLTKRSGLNRSVSGGSLPTMVLQSLEDRSSRTTYHVPRGVTCFAFDPITELLVSGGPDCDLRLWDIRRPEKPSAVLSGHTASIVFLFVQDAGEKIYSLDQKRIVKVWDVRNRILLQTFTELTGVLCQNLPVCAFYNDRDRQLVVASNKLVCLSCCPEIPLDRTDGESHTRPISVLLYNSLYKLIISCGLDSVIITWDHCMNRKMSLITEAHTQMRNGLRESVEITAGCLDGKQQLLATGARDGSVKLWNISGRTCMRTFSMQEDCEVTALFWIANRILAMGWNHRVVEFFASLEQEAEYPRGLPWRKLHSDDILCAAVSSVTPEALATCSYAGELVLWMLETGQPYRRYNAANPHIRVPISFRAEETEESIEPKSDTRRKTIRMSLASRRTMVPVMMKMESRRLSRIVMPMALEQMRKLSIQVLMFLRSRPMHPAFGTLLGSLETGVIQVWSHDPNGGYRAQFNAIHMAGDRVIAMASDASNRFLFTGTALGYIKTWYIENCWIPDADKFKVNKPSLRIRFPFLIDDVIPGRAKRSARSQPIPWLLNSFQAHRSCITGLVYLDSSELLLSSSSDRTVRIWTLGGRYIGLLGSPVSWEPLRADLPPPATGYRFRIPPDLRREVSFTTAKVLRGAMDYQRQFQHSSIGLERSRKCLPAIETYGCPLQEPLVNTTILKLAPKEPVLPTIRLERTFLPSLPVYSHMTQFPLNPIAPGAVTTAMEQLVKGTRELQFARLPVQQH